MKVLIVFPKFDRKYSNGNWPFRYLSKRSSVLPRELLKVSILLPITWEKKRVDVNAEKLKRKDILWADYIIINACEKQRKSTNVILNKCNSFGKKVVACGALFTEFPEDFEFVNHLILDDLRISFSRFVADMENGDAKKVYHSNPFFEIRRYAETFDSIANISNGLSENIQFSYG